MDTGPAHYKQPELGEVQALLFCPSVHTYVPGRASATRPTPGCNSSLVLTYETSQAPLTAASAPAGATGIRGEKHEVPVVGGLHAFNLPAEIRLPHPGEPSAICSFLMTGNNLYELNSFIRNVGATSIFLQEVDCVLGSSPLLLATPLDPLFLFASLLHRHASSDFQPLKQILQRSACSEDVQHNLQVLAMLPQVCKRLHLISDVRKTQKKPNSRLPLLAVKDEPKDSAHREERDVHLDDCCTFSVVKTAAFLGRIIRRAAAAVLLQQQRPLFTKCALPESSAIECFSQQHPLTLGVAEKRTANASRQEGNSSPSLAAAERLVEDCISGYLPKALLEAVKQQHTRSHPLHSERWKSA